MLEAVASFLGLVLKFFLNILKPVLNPIERQIDKLKEAALNQLTETFDNLFNFDDLLVLPKIIKNGFDSAITTVKKEILDAIPIEKMITSARAIGSQIMNPSFKEVGAECGNGKKVKRFKVTGSGCMLSDESGTCFQSTNYPNDYGPNQKCSVKVLMSGDVSSYHFNTEAKYDILTIKNKQYSGITGPSDSAVKKDDVITWSSDRGVQRTGFKVCMQSAEYMRIERMKHNRIPLQSLSSYDCPSTVWKKRKYYQTSHYTSGNLCTASYNNVKSQATSRPGIVKLCTDAGGTFINQCWSGTTFKDISSCHSNSLYTCLMNPKVNSLKKCIGECKSDAHCAPGLKCMVRHKEESVPGCTGRGRKTGNGYTAKYCYDPTYNYLSGYNHPTAWSSQLQACVGECDRDEQCAKVDGVQLKCVQRNAGEKVPGCVGEGKELDGGLVSWDYCTNPVKVKQAADALAAQEIAQEKAEEAAEAKERAAEKAAAKASEESSKRKAAIAATKVSEEISKRKAIYDAKALAKAIKKARFCHNKPADTLFYDEGSATACLAPVAKKVCKDKPGFTNGYGHGCQNYVKHGWCKNGAFVAGQEWTGGVRFKFPENSCCACNRNLKQGAVQSYPMPATTTWAQAKTQCESYGKTMCSRAAICPNGKLKPPFGGTRSGDVWVPTDGTDGTDTSTNEWTSIGTQSVGVRLCKTHKDGLGSSPGWGTTTTSHAFRKEVLCCGGSKIFLYGKSACENQCKPRGTYNNGSPPAACTAVYCDQYKPGKRFASRCIPGDPGHTYAKSECQSTCNICPK